MTKDDTKFEIGEDDNSKVEQKELGEFISRSADAVESLINHGLELTQQNFNS